MQKKTIRTDSTRCQIRLWVDAMNEGRIQIRITGRDEKWAEGTEYTAAGLSEFGLLAFARYVDGVTGCDVIAATMELLAENRTAWTS